jgi:hypothetical protein
MGEDDDDQNYAYGEEMDDLEMNPGLVGMDNGEDEGEDEGKDLDLGEDEPQLIDEEQFMQMSESQQQAYILQMQQY